MIFDYRMSGGDWTLFDESAESIRLMEFLVPLLNCLIVMKSFSLLSKLLQEIGMLKFFNLVSLFWLRVFSLKLNFYFSLATWCFNVLFRSAHIWASLFHVVVDNDGTSTQIIRHLNALKGGRVTFIPLNRVKAPHVKYPQSSDVIPLLKKLKFSDNFAPAFGQVSL